MTRYKDKTGNSGVIAYQIGGDHIAVQFSSGELYLYSYFKPGKRHVEQMKRLAEEGKGLSTYISVNVKENYETKVG